MKARISSVLFGALIGIIGTVGMATASSPARQADRLISEARVELAEAQSLVRAAGHSSHARRQLQESLSDLNGTLTQLDRTVDAMQGPPPPRVVSSGELSRIQGAIRSESFSDDKLAVLRDASRGRQFTSAQVRGLMDLFAFSDDKVDAAVILYPKVVDQQNWYTVYGALTFSSDKDALRARTR